MSTFGDARATSERLNYSLLIITSLSFTTTIKIASSVTNRLVLHWKRLMFAPPLLHAIEIPECDFKSCKEVMSYSTNCCPSPLSVLISYEKLHDYSQKHQIRVLKLLLHCA